MATNNIKPYGTPNAYKSDAGGATLIREPVVAIVKNNIDPTHSGKIDVYIAVLGGNDPDDSTNWIKGVRYMSPFYGVTGAGNGPKDGPDKSGDGKFVGNPQSYGFWASAPDIGTEVICIFVNGRANQGYYIGCVPKPGLLQMTPAIGASTAVVPNATEGTSYGGADRLPTSEVNYSNPRVQKSPSIYNEPKPVHSYQAAILNQQGLIRDNVRGVISSSAQRETPSRVFGISTPGGPIFEGGYTSTTIKSAVKSADPSKLKQIGRTGGHTFVMDDGTLTGQDQLIRLRSSAGHQITMSDTGQTLFIIHSNGQSWIEMGKEGTIDIYSTNSFNVRTQGDINFHADRNININATKNLNLYGENINIESAKDYSQRTGANYTQYTVGKYSVKSDSSLAIASGAELGITSASTTSIQGSKVNLNSGAGPQPSVVPVLTKTSHIDTTNSPTVGWMNPSPTPLSSITNRAPAHQPWVGSGVGVDVIVRGTPTPAAAQTTPAATTVNNSAPATPAAPVTAAAINAAPAVPAAGPITASAAQAMVAQVATSAQAAVTTALPSGIVAAGSALNVASGITPAIIEAANSMKPDAAQQAQALIDKGMPAAKALAGVATGTGALPTVSAMISDVQGQAAAVGQSISKSVGDLTSLGILTGKESVAQAAGAVMGAVTKGVGAVSDLIKNGVSSVAGLADSIAGGKFAAGLADSMNFSGLKDSLSGMVTSVGDKLQSAMQNAFAAVEKSFGTLKAGVVNVLGPKPAGGDAPAPSAAATAAADYDSAAAEVASAEDAYFAAKRDYRNDNSQINNDKLTAAEAAWSAARQKQSQSSTAFLKASVGGAAASLTAAAQGIGDSLKNTLTSGLNALPGGSAALQSVTSMSGSITGALGSASSAISGAVGSVTGALNGATGAMGAVNNVMDKVGGLAQSATGLVGDLLGNTKDMLTSAMDKIGNPLDAIKSGAAGLMGQLSATLSSIGGAAGGVQAAVAAVGTFDKTDMIAKAGQLLGDVKIPMPSFDSIKVVPDVDKAIAEKANAYVAVTDATAKARQAELMLSMTQATMEDNPDTEADLRSTLVTQTVAYEAAMKELDAANKAYASTATG